MSAANRPSFFIAGNSKSGTTALYRFLDAHPDVFMCRPKEPDFFCRDLNLDPDPTHSFHQQSLAEYLALFEGARADQLCGEASAGYFYSQVAAGELHAFDPNAKIILVLREPVSFLHSYHQQMLKNPIWDGESVKDLAKALELEPERKRGRRIPRGCHVPQLLFYMERVRYAHQLQRVYEHFDRSQVLVMLYEDFKRDNAGALRQVLEFLGVDADFSPSFDKHNEGVEVRSRARQDFMRWLGRSQGFARPLRDAVKRVVPVEMRRRLVKTYYRQLVYGEREQMDPALAERLRVRCAPEVVALSELLGRDLVREWGYESLVPRAVAVHA